MGRLLTDKRTSSNAWCVDSCQENERIQRVLRKIEQVVRLPRENFESFQVLRYSVGQKYELHRDMEQ